jgi:cytosine deaminase
MAATVLQRIMTIDGDVTDVRIEGATIAQIGPGLETTPDDEVLDLAGHVLLPSAVEPHAHLDKAFLAGRVENRTGDLMGAIEAMEAARHLLGVRETVERAERAARLMARNGYTAVRTHADVTVDHGVRSIEALVEVRRRVADVIDVEIVAMSGWPVCGVLGADQRALLRDAMAVGADLVGGCPHLESGSTAAATGHLLELAADLGVGVDLHTDETLDPASDALSDLCDQVLAGFPHPATASHCVSLGQRSADEQRRVADLVAHAGVRVVALPHTNLFLQGRDRAPMPRGLTAVAALRAAGATVAAGADNLQDPFNPVGRACPFETAALMVLTSHLLPAEAWRSVSDDARCATGRAVHGIVAGAPADLLVVPAIDVREAIAVAPSERLVWRRGVCTAKPRVHRRDDLPAGSRDLG